jgi:hypothetical protein
VIISLGHSQDTEDKMRNKFSFRKVEVIFMNNFLMINIKAIFLTESFLIINSIAYFESSPHKILVVIKLNMED